MTTRTPLPVDPPQPPADQLDWEPALAYLPILSAPDFDPGEWAGGGQLGPNRYATRDVVFSQDVQRFITCLYDTDIVAGTDWTTWLREGGKAFYVELERLAEATLEQCRILLIAMCAPTGSPRATCSKRCTAATSSNSYDASAT